MIKTNELSFAKVIKKITKPSIVIFVMFTVFLCLFSVFRAYASIVSRDLSLGEECQGEISDNDIHQYKFIVPQNNNLLFTVFLENEEQQWSVRGTQTFFGENVENVVKYTKSTGYLYTSYKTDTVCCITISGVGKYTLKVTNSEFTETTTKQKQSIKASSFVKNYGNKDFPLKAKTNGNGKLIYKSSNKKVATVSSKGKVTIKGCGKTTITIKASETSTYKSVTKKITVIVKPSKLKIKTFKGNKKALKIYYKMQSNADGYQCIYSRGNKKITTTSKKNYVTLKNLSKGHWLAKLRAYKKISGKKFYGSYGKIKFIIN